MNVTNLKPCESDLLILIELLEESHTSADSVTACILFPTICMHSFFHNIKAVWRRKVWTSLHKAQSDGEYLSRVASLTALLGSFPGRSAWPSTHQDRTGSYIIDVKHLWNLQNDCMVWYLHMKLLQGTEGSVQKILLCWGFLGMKKRA